MDRAPAIRLERRVHASPEAVYRHLTDSKLWPRWQGADARLDAAPGGRFSMEMPGGQLAEGAFVELVPDRRVVFTWGWRGQWDVPPGSSTVEVDLVPDGDDTIIRLTHRDLPAEAEPSHRAGWQHYLPRLAMVAEGVDPGADPGPGDQAPAARAR